MVFLLLDMFGTCDAEFLQVYDSFSKDFSSFYARLITSVHKDRVSELVPKPVIHFFIEIPILIHV